MLGSSYYIISSDVTASFPIAARLGNQVNSSWGHQTDVHPSQRVTGGQMDGRTDVHAYAPISHISGCNCQQRGKKERISGMINCTQAISFFSNIYAPAYGWEQVVLDCYLISPRRNKIISPDEQRDRNTSLHPHLAGITYLPVSSSSAAMGLNWGHFNLLNKNQSRDLSFQ